jgi:transposase
MSVYVGIDVHRKRSQVAVVTEDGTVQLNKNVVSGSTPFLQLIGDLPPGTPVASGAAFGWSWLADLLEDYAFEAHLVHPLRCKAIASARLKNDKVDAAILAQLLRADLLPEAWIAPAKVRQLRALLRHRISLVRLSTQLRNRIHAVAADHGYDRSASYWTGPGRGWLAELELPATSREIITDTCGHRPAWRRSSTGSTGSCTSTPRPARGSRHCGRCPAPGSSPHWSSWPRSATSPGSPAPASWPPGPG